LEYPADKNRTDPEKPSRRNRRKHDETRPNAVRALVLLPLLREKSSAKNTLSAEDRLQEAVGLAQAIDLEVIQSGTIRLSHPRPATLFGSGKVEELRGIIEAEHAGLVIVDHPLSPVQQRNLERAWNAKILDRTGLILEIFGARARTKEGRC
jgi:GTP-binding protein HflX